ncbi:MAG: hypothetical protein M3463_10755 [Verrucomicrobiota bacterium]|nr:hypothetical protein [Verrucomicrobiota bacterium]
MLLLFRLIPIHVHRATVPRMKSTVDFHKAERRVADQLITINAPARLEKAGT